MLNLKPGDAVAASAYMKKQFPSLQHATGIVVGTWTHPTKGRMLREGMITVHVNGNKKRRSFHHDFWDKLPNTFNARERQVADKILRVLKPLSRENKVSAIKAVQCLYGML